MTRRLQGSEPGLNTREAAQLLGIPRGTVKSRLQRARMMMREELA